MTYIPLSIIIGAIHAVERLPLPDPVLRAAVATMVARNPLPPEPSSEADADFARAMRILPVAVHTDEANRQHYELPPEFFSLVLGPHRKYSCCYYDKPGTTLAEAELRALEITAERAGLADGQRILELGCGWGSLTLWMAERLPNARITAVSNSRTQKAFIERLRKEYGYVAYPKNVNAVVALLDTNVFKKGTSVSDSPTGSAAHSSGLPLR